LKRLLATAALATGLAAAAPAHATILVCNNVPVLVNCFDQVHHRWCTVWVAGLCLPDDLPPLTA
jgi:hypothetical protein